MCTPLQTVRADTAQRGRTVAARRRRAVAAGAPPAVHAGQRRRQPTACVSQAATGLRRAFTLVEMMVSLAVLTLALSIVGVVFTVTTRTVNQAAAYSEVQNFARQFCLQIEEDLSQVAPSESLLVLVGRTVPAALTADDLAAGRYHCVLIGDPALVPSVYDPAQYGATNKQYSNPRADILMFFTNRPSYSVAPAPNPNNNYHAGAVKLAPVQVVYGHAALGEPTSTGGFPTVLRHIDNISSNGKQSEIPAAEWHLARRGVIIEPNTKIKLSFNSPDEWDRIVGCLPATNFAGDVAQLNLDVLRAEFGPQSTTFGFPGPAVLSPYSANTWGLGLVAPILYNQANVHHVATVFTDLPVSRRTNVGVQMLRGCAWFQVEFLMPEDPRNSLDFLPVGGAGMQERRWASVVPTQTYVFVPDTIENRAAVASQWEPTGSANVRVNSFLSMDPAASASIADKRIRMWPYAIRVTVHVYDPRGRLTDPIIRSVVHRFD